MGAVREFLGELGAELREHRGRVVLSAIGIGYGTLAIVLLLAFSVGFDELFARRARGIGDGVAVCWPLRTTLPWRGLPAGRRIVVTRDDVRALAALPSIAAVSAEFDGNERVRVGERVLRIAVSGVDPEFGSLRALEPRRGRGGRFVDHDDLRLRRRVAFLGDRLARELFPQVEPIGRTLVLGDVPFLVVGVLEPKEQDSDYGGLDASRMFVPATTWAELEGRRAVSNFVYRARDPARQSECTADVVSALAARLRFDPRDHGALSVWDLTEQQRMLGYVFLAFHVVLAIAGLFTLVAGGVGVANLMFLLIRRRSAEIGLKLALGATPARIRGEVVGRTLVLVAASGGGGFLVAALVVAVAGAGPWTTEIGVPRIPVALAVGAATALATVGVAAAWFPARAAARLDPVEALRR